MDLRRLQIHSWTRRPSNEQHATGAPCASVLDRYGGREKLIYEADTLIGVCDQVAPPPSPKFAQGAKATVFADALTNQTKRDRTRSMGRGWGMGGCEGKGGLTL